MVSWSMMIGKRYRRTRRNDEGKYYIDDITVMLEDLDEAWDKG